MMLFWRHVMPAGSSSRLLAQSTRIYARRYLFCAEVLGADPGQMIAVIWSVDMKWVWMSGKSVFRHLAHDNTELPLNKSIMPFQGGWASAVSFVIKVSVSQRRSSQRDCSPLPIQRLRILINNKSMIVSLWFGAFLQWKFSILNNIDYRPNVQSMQMAYHLLSHSNYYTNNN